MKLLINIPQLAIQLLREGYKCDITAYNAGEITGTITRRLVAIVERQFTGRTINLRNGHGTI
ncbi:Small, acid-soluble spore protein, alpha/beta type [Paenibacillus catalpae]|uniref:Small, acid-soluble spore protein, alpha/beta type n=1 Tax=Paenibacillus catalpae TaxID=1045775 RepID=A0A1I1VDC7_9BACL|nr:Small, acid-soluble spore protein, alpha/beta type [Paenibacillus catalpae]